ncbi:MAG TPA: glycoside hydrolase family 5 protein [Chloroflexota bacterium]|nr:glycoside hydrolase family 5 protein [Chloroflexota bacterium]
MRITSTALLVALVAAITLVVYHVTSAMLIPPAGQGYWHTEGVQIDDVNNRPVRIAGVTWFGMESAYWVPAGLDYQPYTRIMDEVKALGYNTIRLPLSNQVIEQNPIVTQMVAANPQLKGQHALTVLDDIVDYAHKIGLKIILDNHRNMAATRHEVNFLNEGLWYSPGYPSSAWLRDWEFLARRYKGNDTVIGFDLRNEPHTQGPGPWNLHAYLYQGATWGPYRGVDNPNTDWRLAATRAGNAILKINPHLLIIVEGLQLYPWSPTSSAVENYWWGSILRQVRQYPVVLKVPHQLVYEAHDWGPWKWEMAWFKHMSYAGLQKVWESNWAFIDNPTWKFAAPVWIGEFGTCTTNPQCIDDVRPGNQAQWFHFLLRYLHDHPEIGWSFYALNGTNSNDHTADNGLLNAHWDGVQIPALQKDLASIQDQ